MPSFRRYQTLAIFAGACLLLLLAACRPIEQAAERMREHSLLKQLSELDPIDSHTHIAAAGTRFLSMLDDLHLHVLDILYVDDTTEYRSSLERQRADALKFIASSNGRAALCTTFDPFRSSESGFVQQSIESLNADFAIGAVAAKVWKNIGMEVKDASGKYLPPDDPMLSPIYRDIAEHNKTLIIHAADPDSAWSGHYPTSASKRYYSENPQWRMETKPGAPTKSEILRARDEVVRQNPQLRVIGAHLGSMDSDLANLSDLLDHKPNFAVDTAGRISRLAALPRDQVREFFLKHQDQILYGTDLVADPESDDEATVHDWRRRYAMDWRYFATDDTFIYQGERVKGLQLPRDTLQKIYHDNAVHWLPGISASKPR
jgi:hypothetical protein